MINLTPKAHYALNVLKVLLKPNQPTDCPVLCLCLWLPLHLFECIIFCLQCFDTVGWASGRASGL